MTLPPAILPGGLAMSFRIERFVTDLPDPDSPTMPRDFAAVQVEGDAVHSLHEAVFRAELGREILHAQYGFALHARHPI